MKKIFKNKKGMTLIEVIVTMAISAILMTSVAAVLPPVLKIYQRANTMAERNTLLNNVANHMVSEMSYVVEGIKDGSGALIPSGSSSTDNVLLNTGNKNISFGIDTNGYLTSTVNGQTNSVFPQGFYDKHRVSFLVSNNSTVDQNLYTLTVSVLTGEEDELSRTYAVSPIVLNPYTD